jgi:magnesium-transporting ATPase (P-type)
VLKGPAQTGRLLDKRLLGRAFGVLGPVEALVQLGAFVAVLMAGGWRWGEGASVALVVTASGTAFTVVVLGQLANAFACRSETRPVGRWSFSGNRLLLGAVACELLLLAVFLAVPAVATVLGQALPTALGIGLALLVVPAVLLADAAYKAAGRRT